MKKEVEIAVYLTIEVDAEGEEIHDGEYEPGEGYVDNSWVKWDNEDVFRKTQEFVTSHFGKDTEFEIL